MQNEIVIPESVIHAVKQKLKALDEAVAFVRHDVEIKRDAYQKAESALHDIENERSELVGFLEANETPTENAAGAAEAVPDAGSTAVQVAGVPQIPTAPRAISPLTAVKVAKANLMFAGDYWKVPDIYTGLQRLGYVIPVADPVRRLTQAMSASKLFEADRTLGWRVKTDKAIDPNSIA